METRGEAQELCRTLVDHARDKIRGRGDELGELIGPESQPLAGQPEGQRSGS